MRQLHAVIVLIMQFFAVSAQAADLQVSESIIDYGTIEEGPPVVKKIILTNSGTQPLIIANATASWGCTSVALGKRRLKPGESTELEITYQTYKYPGKFDKSVSVFTGPGGEEKTVIRLVGKVDPVPMGVIAMEPRKTDVGLLTANKENEVQIVIKNTGDATLTVSRIESTTNDSVYFDAEKKGPMVLAAGEKKTAKFFVSPSQPGRFLDVIFIYSDARNDIGKGYKALLSGAVK
jgi:hypothetical protein